MTSTDGQILANYQNLAVFFKAHVASPVLTPQAEGNPWFNFNAVLLAGTLLFISHWAKTLKMESAVGGNGAAGRSTTIVIVFVAELRSIAQHSPKKLWYILCHSVACAIMLAKKSVGLQ